MKCVYVHFFPLDFHSTKCYFPVHNTCCLISSHSFSGEVVCHFTLNWTVSFVCNNMLKSFAYFCFFLQLLAPQQTTSTRELTERMESEKKKRARKNWAKIRWKLITWEDWGACVMLEHPIPDDHHQMRRPRKYILFHLSAPTQLDSE